MLAKHLQLDLATLINCDALWLFHTENMNSLSCHSLCSFSCCEHQFTSNILLNHSYESLPNSMLFVLHLQCCYFLANESIHLSSKDFCKFVVIGCDTPPILVLFYLFLCLNSTLFYCASLLVGRYREYLLADCILHKVSWIRFRGTVFFLKMGIK